MRSDDWPQIFAEFVEARSSMPFEWQTNDCVTFAADWAFAVTGADPIADVRGSWTTKIGAARALNRFGGLAEAIGSRLEEISPAFAQRGDVGLVDVEDGEALVIVGYDNLIGPGPNGLTFLPRDKMKRAWKVG
jgi:hypothetical protein